MDCKLKVTPAKGPVNRRERRGIGQNLTLTGPLGYFGFWRHPSRGINNSPEEEGGTTAVAPRTTTGRGRSTHEVAKLFKEVMAVMRTRRSLRVILDAKDRESRMAKPLERLVIEVDVARDDVAR